MDISKYLSLNQTSSLLNVIEDNKLLLTYCITVDLGTIMLKCNNHVRIEHLFDNKSLLFYYQPEPPSDKESNQLRGTTLDICRGPLVFLMYICIWLQILHDTWSPMNSLQKLSSAVILGVGTVSLTIFKHHYIRDHELLESRVSF